MTKISFHLPDELKDGLEGRVRDSSYADVDAYLVDLIRADLEREQRWITPELAAAIEEGEASAYAPYGFKSIVAEARAKFHEK